MPCSFAAAPSSASSGSGAPPGAPPPCAARRLALWTVGAAAFPLGGLAAHLLAGPVADTGSALAGGAVTGLVLGAGQVTVSSGRLRWWPWLAGTTVGTSFGLAVGSAAVGHGTGLGDLVAQGAVTGLVLGSAQALALPDAGWRRWLWAGGTAVLWALGWAVTTAAGVDVEAQYTVFGASGALVVSVLSGLLLSALRLPPPGPA